MSIQLASSDVQIEQCFPVMSQLRSHLDFDVFVSQVKNQMEDDYQLAFLEDREEIIAVAGFRISTSLSWGRFLYVFDLVVDESKRSQSYGQQLFQWLIKYAKDLHCQQLHLDSGVQRFDAHRFYIKQSLNITGHHFALEL